MDGIPIQSILYIKHQMYLKRKGSQKNQQIYVKAIYIALTQVCHLFIKQG